MPQMTAASYPVFLGDRELRMTPLTDKDIDALTNWLRAEIIEVARKGAAGLDRDERAEILEAAISKAHSVQFGEDAFTSLGKIKALLRTWYQGFLKNHPTLKFDDFCAMIKEQEDFDKIQLVWEELNMPKKHPVAAGSGGGSEPNERGAVRDAGENLQVPAAGGRGDDAAPADGLGVG